MLSAIRSRVTYANVTATLALLFAMTGGAYAAKAYLITSTKQIKPTVLKSLQGKAGAKGANGAPGVAGPAGAAGAGTPGPQGPAGPQGSAGAKGETGTAGSAGSAGKEGKEGKEGKAGATGFTATLPSGKTETGTWSVSASASREGFEPTTTMSFPIPLSAEGPKKAFAFSAEETEEEKFGASGCTGSVLHPTAPAGVLCVYTAFETLNKADRFAVAELRIPGSGGESGYGTSGATLYAYGVNGTAEEPGTVEAEGTWAVTAP
jgi:hypothetical protein